MRVIFWNTRRCDLGIFIRALVDENDADLLILAESRSPTAALLEKLNEGDVRWSYAPSLGISNTEVFVRGRGDFVIPKYDLPHMSIRRVFFPGSTPFILATVHLISRLWRSEYDQAAASRDSVQALRDVELDLAHSRSVVVGDFNMDPFSKGLILADSWNAVRTVDIAKRRQRTVDGRAYGYFFNPMWRLLCDGRNGRPAGTYFHGPTGYESLHWHILDQVLLRPSMLKYFDHDSVSILKECGEGNLASANGRPNTSDHFPLLFSLRI